MRKKDELTLPTLDGKEKLDVTVEQVEKRVPRIMLNNDESHVIFSVGFVACLWNWRFCSRP